MSNRKDHIHFYEGIRLETRFSREEIRARMTDDYLRGLIEGEGHFGLDTKTDGKKIPAFVLKMHVRDKELIEGVRDHLKLRNKVYEYRHQGRHYAMLIVRDIGDLKNIIIPLCRGKLLGHKGTQFEWWIKYFPLLNSLMYRDREIENWATLGSNQRPFACEANVLPLN